MASTVLYWQLIGVPMILWVGYDPGTPKWEAIVPLYYYDVLNSTWGQESQLELKTEKKRIKEKQIRGRKKTNKNYCVLSIATVGGQRNVEKLHTFQRKILQGKESFKMFLSRKSF
jgi:hypothetical protein